VVRYELQEMLIVTETMEKITHEKTVNKDREKVIKELNILLEKREKLMQNIEAPYSEEEHNLGKEIVKKNKVIDRRIKEIFNELKNEIKQFNAYKSRNNLYENPYHSVQVMDGMFLDQKK